MRFPLSSLPSLAAGLALAASAHGTTLFDPLHAFCYGTSSCSDNGTVTPTTTNPPEFGFSISPGPQTGDFLVDVLVPNNEVVTPSSLSFSLTGTQGGALNNQSLSASATLFSTTAWTSGQLDAYLGISASPSNAIGAFLPYTQSNGDAAATGYFVYVADLGTNQLMPNTSELSGPLLNISSLPQSSLVFGFLNTGTAGSPNYIATANSGFLFEDGAPTPEPTSLLLMTTGFAGFACMVWVRRRA